MQFSAPAPGLLTPEFLGTWTLGDVTGMSRASASSWINGALNNPLGWGRAGVSFQEVSSGGPVYFHVVTTISGDANILGQAQHFSDGSCSILLEAAYLGNDDLVNHEAAHAFFFAEHSPEGSDSIEEPIEDPGEEWPSATDIAQLVAWLGGAMGADATYWFPGDLPSYITKWIVPSGAFARLATTVIKGIPGQIRPVFSSNLDDMLAGDYESFCRAVGTDSRGFYAGEWKAARGTGEIYVGLIVEAEGGVSIDQLVIGVAEVQIADPSAFSSRTIPN